MYIHPDSDSAPEPDQFQEIGWTDAARAAALLARRARAMGRRAARLAKSRRRANSLDLWPTQTAKRRESYQLVDRQGRLKRLLAIPLVREANAESSEAPMMRPGPPRRPSKRRKQAMGPHTHGT